VNISESAPTILLVEDDASVRASMALFFKSHGYRIVSAASLDQTLAVVGKLPRPDLLITDFHLSGGKNGSDVITCVREALGECLPAILISGDMSAEIGNWSHDASVRFASKPIDPDSLVTLAQELLLQRAAASTDN
jgi:DNA-binding NtrC family response regulator